MLIDVTINRLLDSLVEVIVVVVHEDTATVRQAWVAENQSVINRFGQVDVDAHKGEAVINSRGGLREVPLSYHAALWMRQPRQYLFYRGSREVLLERMMG